MSISSLWVHLPGVLWTLDVCVWSGGGGGGGKFRNFLLTFCVKVSLSDFGGWRRLKYMNMYAICFP